VHGNETCGTRGIQRVMAEIDSGALTVARGRVTFVPVTNPLAYAKGERAGDRNLNRNLGPVAQPADYEDHVANWLCPLLMQHEALLDLHSTRAKSRPFAMLGPHDNQGSLQPFGHSRQERALAQVLGVDRFVEGWLESYEKGVKRRVARGTGSKLNSDPRYGVGTTEYMRSVGGYAMTLECGQHEDPDSPEVAYRAIRNALAFLQLVDSPSPAPVERYEALRLVDVIDRDHARGPVRARVVELRPPGQGRPHRHAPRRHAPHGPRRRLDRLPRQGSSARARVVYLAHAVRESDSWFLTLAPRQ
jgi:predicted deacylase